MAKSGIISCPIRGRAIVTFIHYQCSQLVYTIVQRQYCIAIKWKFGGIHMKYKDTIDLYDDEGKLLKSNVTLDKISPLVNKGALNVIDLTKRTVRTSGRH